MDFLHQERPADGGLISNHNEFLAFLISKKFLNFNSVFFRCISDANKIWLELKHLENQGVFSLKRIEHYGNVTFVLENINRTAYESIKVPTLIDYSTNRKSLADQNLALEKKSFLIRGSSNTCSLPPEKLEYRFCEAMFRFRTNEPQDWTRVAEIIYNGEEIDFTNPNEKRSIRDAMKRINSKIRKAFNVDEDLFSFKQNHIIRHH